MTGGVMLTTLLHLVSRMRKSGGVLPRLRMYSWRAREYLYKRVSKIRTKKNTQEGVLRQILLYVQHPKGKKAKIAYNFVSKNYNKEIT